MKPQLAILALALLAAGCVTPPEENKTNGTIIEDPAITSIKITSLPATVEAGQPVAVKWTLEGFASSTNHTAIHWGYKSVPDPKSPSDYPAATTFRSTDIPATLEDSFTPSQPGTVHLRAHTLIYNAHFWSDEKTITVTEPEKPAYSLRIDAPLPEAEITGNVTVRVTPVFLWTDVIYNYYLDGKLVETTTSQETTLAAEPGPHTIKVETANGPATISAEVSITVKAPSQAAKEFTIETDDKGFYPDNGMITVSKGDAVKITFVVPGSDRVYFGGMDVRSKFFNTGSIGLNSQKTVEFTASETFSYTSYWPASGVSKATATVTVS
jgi:hypothetical protein